MESITVALVTSGGIDLKTETRFASFLNRATEICRVMGQVTGAEPNINGMWDEIARGRARL